MVEFVEILRLLRPYDAVGVDKIRLGGQHDGGYILLDDLVGIEAAIGAGVGWDVSFEHALAEQGIPVDLYDHTVDRLPTEHANFKFYRQRLSHQPAPDGKTLDQVAAHIRPGRGLLKMDIEGDEWPILANVKPETLRSFRQIVCELHNLQEAEDHNWRQAAMAALHNLARHFSVVHVHGNNCAHTTQFNGKTIPAVVEVTFASKTHYATWPSSRSFPTPLDRSNSEKTPDVELGAFVF